ncbi:hypothetical protein SO802_010824 [Lithocarpus litseifolius]|uniref:Reverse transcriptase domain-containing protein n=1 Tax=Lithocarpus litseifolius TaxID=425828 RepID=A0AAW2DFA2_9ROSI
MNIFTAGTCDKMEECLNTVNHRIIDNMLEMLSRPYSSEEVKAALFRMGPTKAPGPDDMNVLFYLKFWHIVVLVNRLKLILPQIISPFQSAFVPSRLITDNVVIAYETLHAMHIRKKGKKEALSLKLDVSKAYDRVEWASLRVFVKEICCDLICFRFVRNRGTCTPSPGATGSSLAALGALVALLALVAQPALVALCPQCLLCPLSALSPLSSLGPLCLLSALEPLGPLSALSALPALFAGECHVLSSRRDGVKGEDGGKCWIGVYSNAGAVGGGGGVREGCGGGGGCEERVGISGVMMVVNNMNNKANMVETLGFWSWR